MKINIQDYKCITEQEYTQYMQEHNLVRAVHIAEGLKVYCPNKEYCLNLERELNKLNIQTRSACNVLGTWSIYIISVPEELETPMEINW